MINQKQIAQFSLSIFLFAFSFNLFAQSETDLQLAQQYLLQEEYDKAKIYYEKFYKDSPKDDFYQALLKCYLQTEDYKEAEKLAKKQSKIFPNNIAYKVDLGLVYKTSGEDDKAKKQFEETIKEVEPDYQQIKFLAESFQRIQEVDYALETYLRGRKIVKNYPFNIEVAQIYGQRNEFEKMISEYLDILKNGEFFMQQVQNALQTSLDPDPDNKKKDLLKTELLRRIQKEPNSEVYSDMLIWLYIQERNFNGAFVQSKAIDKRKNENGFRIWNLAGICMANKEYEVAIKCYQYLTEKDNDDFYFTSAKKGLLDAYYKKITESNYTKEELLNLESIYENTLKELGKGYQSIHILRDYAQLEAFYLHNTEKALAILEEAMKIGNLNTKELSITKLLLADVYLITGEIWEASLLYSQVEKAYKHDQLGETAKFKNAKISFYDGDFAWAKAQLDVLKASTSKLIANDAMQLSILITDNTILDTNKIPLLMYARADLLTFQNKTNAASLTLDSIQTLYPLHSLNDEVLYKKYEISLKEKQYEKAASYLIEVAKTYSNDVLADDALYNLAKLYDFYLSDKDKAMENYKLLMLNFPGSLYVDDARKRFRQLRENEVYIKSYE